MTSTIEQPKVWGDGSTLKYASGTAFLIAISPLPDIDQARLIAIACRANYRQVIMDPAIREWIMKNAHLFKGMFKEVGP